MRKSKDILGITLVQSLIGRNKFNYFLEKAVEIGVDRVIPVESQYSHINKNKALREYGLWKKIVTDATEQSRNIKPTIVEKPIRLKDLNCTEYINRVCLTTENVKGISLNKYIDGVDVKKPFVIAIGPERGWGSKDINVFRELDFQFVRLQGNILRAESVGLVISSIIKYLRGEI